MSDDQHGSSLEYGTKLGRLGEGRWTFSLYPDAAEGGGSFRSGRDSGGGDRGLDSMPADSEGDAARRARGKVRRYCAANRLNRLGTLTYATACRDQVRLRHDLAVFFRRLRGAEGQAFPYLWVPEWHPGGHGLHAHFALGRYIHYRAIRAAWPHGVIDIRLLGDLPVGSGTLGEARLAAHYLAKYVAKDLAAGHVAGQHRYEVAQRFQPRRLVVEAATADGVLASAGALMGAIPENVWRSRDEIDWSGPPAVWAQWR